MNELMRRLLFLPEQASDHARQVDALHFFVISTTMIAAAGVFATAIWFFVRYRRRDGDGPTPRVEPKAIHEVIFVGLPLVFFLLWFAIGFRALREAAARRPRTRSTCTCMGKQWMWKFAYPERPERASTCCTCRPAARCGCSSPRAT